VKDILRTGIATGRAGRFLGSSSHTGNLADAGGVQSIGIALQSGAASARRRCCC
jgi:hypothetical protein